MCQTVGLVEINVMHMRKYHFWKHTYLYANTNANKTLLLCVGTVMWRREKESEKKKKNTDRGMVLLYVYGKHQERPINNQYQYVEI